MKPLPILIFIGIAAVAVGAFFRWRLINENLSVASWWRSEEKNVAVGGVAKSKHLIGWAFDIVPVNDIVRAKLRRIGFAKILNEGDHFHVEII